MASRAFSSTSSSEAAGAAEAAGVLPAAGAEAPGVAPASAAAGALLAEPFDMKNQPPAAAASTATTMPIMRTGDLPVFASPPELAPEEEVTALSASAVEEIRTASLIARSMGPV